MNKRSWSLHECVSRLVAGTAAGAGFLYVAVIFISISEYSLWGPYVKSHWWRWQIAEFISIYALPTSIAAGAFAGLRWRWSRELQLSRKRLIGYCLTVAFVAQSVRPQVSRIRIRGFSPFYEVIPDRLFLAFCVAAALMALWWAVPWSTKRTAEPSEASSHENETSPSFPAR